MWPPRAAPPLRGSPLRKASPESAIAIYREIEHTADRAFRVRGRDLAELFRNAARALFALQGVKEGGEAGVRRGVEVDGGDRETLLVNWLNELLYLQETQHEVYTVFDIQELSQTHLRAEARGRPQRQPQDKLIKAVTFHNLEVKQTEKGWEATVVVDV